MFLDRILDFVGDLLLVIIIILIIGAVFVAVLYLIDPSQNYGIINAIGDYSDVILRLALAGIILILSLEVGWLLSNFGAIALESLGIENANDFISLITLSPLYFLTTYGIIVFIAILIYKSG